MNGEDVSRGFRASSAPPLNCGSPRRFTTSVHLPCNVSDNQRPIKTSENEPQVRHIPIFVEGRDDPVLPRVVEEENDTQKAAENRKQQATAGNSVPVAKQADKHSDDLSNVSKKPIPMPFYPIASSKSEDGKTITSGSTAIPLPFPGEDESSTNSTSQTAKPAKNQPPHLTPIPMPYGSSVLQESRDSSESPNQIDNLNNPEIELIDNIKREAEMLFPRIEAFRGNRDDREFLYLDEMLTRHLLKLDNVNVEGREDVRLARKETIKSIQRCINLLESKIRNVRGDSRYQATNDSIRKHDEPGNARDVKDSSQVISSVVIPIKVSTIDEQNCG